MALGAVMIALGFPTLLVGGIHLVYDRIFVGSISRMHRQITGPNAPIWWWFLRVYFNGLGLPLFFAALVGVLASVFRIRDTDGDSHGIGLVLLSGCLAVLLASNGSHGIHAKSSASPLLVPLRVLLSRPSATLVSTYFPPRCPWSVSSLGGSPFRTYCSLCSIFSPRSQWMVAASSGLIAGSESLIR